MQGQQLDSHQGLLAREDIFPVEEVAEPADELQAALAAAREPGRRRVAEILAEDDMLSTEAFADLLGVSRSLSLQIVRMDRSRSRRGQTGVSVSRHGNSLWTAAIEPHNSNSASGSYGTILQSSIV
ncbi:hypothetical protein AJ87_40820 [Rhizobium yanglingense]|nr:hypothetical protein AJ87_40820 [Rhizobium yanglingense]